MLQQFDERNRDLILNIDGELVHRDHAGVSPFDSSVQNGDTVWEGLRLYEGRIFKLKPHLQRLRASAEMLHYEGYPEDDHIVQELKRTLDANRMYDGVHIRLIISRGLKYTSGLDPRINRDGCSMFILPEFKPPVYDKSGVTLVTARHRRPPENVLDQKIHSSNQITSILAKLEANAAGVDDALMLDLEGNLAETNATHVFVGKGETLLTSTTRCCPTGITRATVLELCQENQIPCRVRDIPHAELFSADEMFVTGTMGELVPVVRLDDHRYEVGPLYRRLSELFAAHVAAHEDPKLVDGA